MDKDSNNINKILNNNNLVKKYNYFNSPKLKSCNTIVNCDSNILLITLQFRNLVSQSRIKGFICRTNSSWNLYSINDLKLIKSNITNECNPFIFSLCVDFIESYSCLPNLQLY